MEGTTYWISLIILLIMGTILAIVIFSKKTQWRERENERISENKKNTEILRERFAKGEISGEEFEKLADKLDPIKSDRRITIIIVLIGICIFIAASAFSMYIQSTIDCNLPVSHYPSWANRDYATKCDGNSLSLIVTPMFLAGIVSGLVLVIIIVIYAKKKSDRH